MSTTTTKRRRRTFPRELATLVRSAEARRDDALSAPTSGRRGRRLLATPTSSIDDVIAEIGITPRRAYGLYQLRAVDGTARTLEEFRARCRVLWRGGRFRVGMVRRDSRDGVSFARGSVLAGAFDDAGCFSAREIGCLLDGRFLDAADFEADCKEIEDFTGTVAIVEHRRELARSLPHIASLVAPYDLTEGDAVLAAKVRAGFEWVERAGPPANEVAWRKGSDRDAR